MPLAPDLAVRPLVRFVALAALGVAAFFAIATTQADPDLWGHVRFGLDILQTRRLHPVDPYSFTSDRPWVNHEWLSEVLFATVWRFAGASGLIAVKVAIVAGAILFVLRTLIARGVSRDTRIMLGGLAVIGIFPRILYVRPQLFSVLLLAALVLVVTHAERGRRTALAANPVILAFWANLHGGWITGLASLTAWTLVDAWERRGEATRAWDGAAWLFLSFLATLLNPYGVGLWGFLFDTVRPGREAIGEWGPAWNEPAVLVVWAILAWLTATAAFAAGPSRDLRRFVLPVLWGVASLTVVRLDAFFALSVIGFLGREIERFLRRSPDRPPLPMALRSAMVSLMAILSLGFPSARSALSGIWMQAGEWPEPASVEFIHANSLSGRMLTYFNWGQYAIWHLPRNVKVSMDGRRETVYSDAMIDSHLRFYAATEDGLAFAERLDADYAWLPVRSASAGALKERGWVIAFEGQQSAILVSPRRSVAAPFAQPATARAPRARLFPGP